MAEKLDLKKKFKELYTASAKPVFVTVPPLRILSVDGAGDPNTSQEFSQAVEALFSVAYKLKFTAKKELCWDYAVMPMEGLWWAVDMARFSVERKEGWQWRIFIVQPDFITETMVAAAVVVVRKAKPSPVLGQLRFEELAEGLCAQVLHVGSFASEGPTITGLHEFIKASGRSFDGTVQKHHEIYLSDMRRTPAEKLRTILRQPIV